MLWAAIDHVDFRLRWREEAHSTDFANTRRLLDQGRLRVRIEELGRKWFGEGFSKRRKTYSLKE